MRRLQFKFPNQIRIFGWDFGSSARAMNQAGGKDSLMTYESVPTAQADLGKVSRSTTERKSMSTKTSIKRIALVAVVGLGFGLLTGVAANAAHANNDTNQAFAATLDTTQTSYAGRVGQQVSIAVTGSVTGSTPTSPATASLSIAAALTSQPATSSVYATVASVGSALGTGLTLADTGTSYGTAAQTNATTITNTGSATNVATINYTSATHAVAVADIAAHTQLATVTFTPTVAGTYSVVVWNEKDRTVSNYTGTGATSSATNASLSGTESYQTFTINVAAGVGSVSLTPINAVAAAGNSSAAGNYGSLVKVQIKDAAGNAATLVPGEFVTLTPTSGGIVNLVNKSATSSSAATSYNLSSANFDSTGTAWVNITDAATAEDIVTLTATVSGGAGSSTTLTFEPVEGVNYQPVAYGTSGFISGTNATSIPVGAQSITYQIVGTASKYQQFEVVDGANNLTAFASATVSGLYYDAAVKGSAAASGTIAAGTAFYTVSSTNSAAAASIYTVNNKPGTTTANTASVIAIAAGTATATPSTINSAVGATNKITVLLKDNFKRAYASQTLSATVAGKNPTTVAQTAVTDANGYATFSFTDANTNASTQDTVTITGGSASITVNITYGTNAVSSVLVDSGDTAAGVNALFATPADIAAGKAGATANLAAIDAYVTNAAGAALAGVPVTFSVSGTGAAIPSNEVTVYTDTTGYAYSHVYAWVTGSYTVTATAGGKSGTGLQSFNQQTATEVRTISATVAGNTVTATAKDRFGNPVVGATLYAITTGGASIGGALVASTPATDKNGQVSWVVTGSGSVQVTTINPSASTTAATDQSSAAAGYVAGDVVTPVAFTAYAAGTTLTAETGVGSTYAPAGIKSVSVDVVQTAASDSVDAANEATDAANAATDAANAAAEAADAATAAAQDAQAAVAALASQVADLIAGIKAQITALTNLVIKIQKKVKA